MPPRSPARILYVDHAPIMGGAEVFLLNLIKALDSAHFRPLVATSHYSPMMRELAHNHIESVAVPFGRLNHAGAALPFNLMRAAWAVARVARQHFVALIHTHTVRAHIVGSLAAQLAGVPLVWTLYDNTFPPAPVRFLSPFPTQVITVSDWLRNLYGPLGLAHKLHVVPNGIPVSDEPGPMVAIRAEFNIPPDAPLVIDVGRLVAGKAPHLFVEASRIVARTVPTAYFMLVGGPDELEPGQRPPPYADELAATVRSCGLGHHLIATGRRPEVTSFYAAADLVVYCATQPEGLPTVLLEAMHHAKPVVATAIGGALEIVQDNITGRLVPRNDAPALAAAITQLLQKPEQMRTLGQTGYARLKKEFDLQAQVARIERVYEEILI